MSDEFFDAYVVCALWASNDNATPDGGYPLDAKYNPADIAPETLTVMRADCDLFIAENEAALSAVVHVCDADRAGHNFWLTRNGHGSGFWDEYFGDDEALTKAFDQLSDASTAFGTFDLYVGDDGMIHGS